MFGGNAKNRSGDEHYTPLAIVIQLRNYFNIKGKKIWCPFCIETSNMIIGLKEHNEVYTTKQLLDKYGIEPIVYLIKPDKYLSDEYDFFDYFRLLKDYLVRDGFIIFDNPPFSESGNIYKTLYRQGIDYFLFDSGLTFISHNPYGAYGGGCFIGHGIKYENSNKSVNTILISNTFNRFWHTEFRNDAYLYKDHGFYKNYTEHHFLSSAELHNWCWHCGEISIKTIVGWTQFKKFGGDYTFDLRKIDK